MKEQNRRTAELMKRENECSPGVMQPTKKKALTHKGGGRTSSKKIKKKKNLTQLQNLKITDRMIT